MTDLRTELPDLPTRMKKLPVDHRGYPVPYFVVWLDEDDNPVERGTGKPDFRILAPNVVRDNQRGLCWLCGQTMGSYKVVVVGPMCVVNRVTAEGCCHYDCARFAVEACPFIVRPHARRQETNMPEGYKEIEGMIKHNPGVMALYVTKKGVVPFNTPNGDVLMRLGEPERVEWYAEGREATSEEAQAALDKGLPNLEREAEAQGGSAPKSLRKQIDRALPLFPVGVTA